VHDQMPLFPQLAEVRLERVPARAGQRNHVAEYLPTWNPTVRAGIGFEAAGIWGLTWRAVLQGEQG
jgi:hypothetical protein